MSRKPTPKSRKRRAIKKAPEFKTTIRGRNGIVRPAFIEEGECWRSTGKKQGGKYPMANGSPAHRVYYECAYGPIPKGMEIHHLIFRCIGPECCNPRHLVAVSAIDHDKLHRDGSACIAPMQGEGDAAVERERADEPKGPSASELT